MNPAMLNMLRWTAGSWWREPHLGGAVGLEPTTLCLEGRCSFHLSYAPDVDNFNPFVRHTAGEREAPVAAVCATAAAAGMFCALPAVGS